MDNATHVLAVGASGMLAEVVLELARRGNTVSLMARRADVLEQFAAQASELPGSITAFPLDYTDMDSLADGLRTCQALHGPVDKALCWVHSHASEASLQIASSIGNPATPIPYYDLRGTASRPEALIMRDRGLLAEPGIRLYRIQLGRIRADNHWRWLTDGEICRGTLDAMHENCEFYVIGES